MIFQIGINYALIEAKCKNKGGDRKESGQKVIGYFEKGRG
jgi:hypothetical protein